MPGDQTVVEEAFSLWPTGRDAAKTLRDHQAQRLLAANDPKAAATRVCLSEDADGPAVYGIMSTELIAVALLAGDIPVRRARE